MILLNRQLPNAPAHTPVRPLRWTGNGRVKVRHDRTLAGFIVFGDFFEVTIFELEHTDGRAALAAELRRLPKAPTNAQPACAIS
jgi:hypothetical protein